MVTLWLLAGSTENWFTGMYRKVWGIPENPRSITLWEKINHGDIGIFHATKNSAYWYGLQPSILGYGLIENKDRKDTYWWDDEIKNRKNRWPLIIRFKKIYVVERILDIDFTNSVKPDNDLIRQLSHSGYKYSDFRKRAESFYPDIRGFTDQKSLQELEERYQFVLDSFEFRELSS